MAVTLPCDNHPDTVAVILTTNLEAGETLTMCWECTLQWAQMLVGLSREPENLEEITPPVTEEVADLEPELPAPDAEPKSEPEPATPPAEEAEHQAEAAQEATTPGE